MYSRGLKKQTAKMGRDLHPGRGVGPEGATFKLG